MKLAFTTLEHCKKNFLSNLLVAKKLKTLEQSFPRIHLECVLHDFHLL